MFLCLSSVATGYAQDHATLRPVGGSVEFSVTQEPGTDLQWFLNGSAIAGAEGTDLTADASGTYTVVATNNAGCFTASDAVEVTVLPVPAAPELLADGTTTFCEGASVLLTASGEADATFQWSLDGAPITGGEDGELTASSAGNYTVTAINVEGCASVASNAIEVLVDAVPATPAVAATGVTTFCEGGSVALQAAGAPDDNYQWSVDGMMIPGAEGPSIDVAEAGNYTVVATNTAGCSSAPSAGTLVTVLPVPGVPTLEADGITTFCEGGSVQLIAEGDAGATFQWSLDGNAISGGEAGTLTATAEGSYTVAAVNTEGCATDASDAVVLTVNALPATPSVDIAGPTTFCQGDFVALEASSDPGVAFQWSLDGEELVWAVEALLEAEETGSWAVTATNDAGCTSTSEAIEVTAVAIPADPTISANGATSFCEGTGVTLVADAEGVAYTWLLDGSEIGGANDQELTVTSAGSYSLVVTVDPGCSSEVSNTIDVEVFFAPAAPELTRNVDTLFATGSGSFQWFLNGNPIPGATDDQLVVTENGDYTVEITDANGCSTLSAVFPFNSVGLDAAQTSGMRVYPNPNDGAFVLELDHTTDTYFTIHDATGKLVKQGAITGPVTQMELREGAGLYFLQIVQAGVPSTHRIVVGH